ncbi:MAG: GNAT family N-acetyltransferase [Pyrinomonadaceae bacterium]
MSTQHNARIIPDDVPGGEVIFPNVLASKDFAVITEGRYEVRLAQNGKETASALKLRYQVFSLELACEFPSSQGSVLEYDAFDFKCQHLVVIDRNTGETVGTFRLNTLEAAGSISGFYSSNEFTIGDLPAEVLQDGIEIGRACIAREHRNTKVAYLLGKGLMRYMAVSGKRYFFGCCSMFTQDEHAGKAAYLQMVRDGHLDDSFWVTPVANGLDLIAATGDSSIELPSLFNMYLRIGAKVCGPPMIDREFGTIDFFVVFDVTKMNEKYRRMFVA